MHENHRSVSKPITINRVDSENIFFDSLNIWRFFFFCSKNIHALMRIKIIPETGSLRILKLRIQLFVWDRSTAQFHERLSRSETNAAKVV